jgi:fructoselysine-6-P-deglycase FrlB-like protein
MKPQIELMLNYLNSTQNNLSALLNRSDELIAKLDRIPVNDKTNLYFIGNGSSGEDANIAAYLSVKLLGKLPHCCTPYSFTHGLIDAVRPQDIVVAISQTGTSHEVVESLRLANKKEAYTISLTATAGSPVMKEAKIPLLFTECLEHVDYKVTGVLGLLYGLWIMILGLALHNHKIDQVQLAQHLSEIKDLNGDYNRLAKTTADWVNDNGEILENTKTLTILGTGDLRETAMEFAVKSIEVQSRFCMAVETEEFLHGICAANPKDNLIILLVDPRSSAYIKRVYDVIVSRKQNVLWIGSDAPSGHLKLDLKTSETYSTIQFFPVIHACIIAWAIQKNYGDHGAEVFADYQKKLKVREE